MHVNVRMYPYTYKHVVHVHARTRSPRARCPVSFRQIPVLEAAIAAIQEATQQLQVTAARAASARVYQTSWWSHVCVGVHV